MRGTKGRARDETWSRLTKQFTNHLTSLYTQRSWPSILKMLLPLIDFLYTKLAGHKAHYHQPIIPFETILTKHFVFTQCSTTFMISTVKIKYQSNVYTRENRDLFIFQFTIIYQVRIANGISRSWNFTKGAGQRSRQLCRTADEYGPDILQLKILY